MHLGDQNTGLEAGITMSNLLGEFQIDNSNLLRQGEPLHLVISQRQKPTAQKPRKYLLQRVSPKHHIYISSLFEWAGNASNEATGASETFSFDWKGTNYFLNLNYTTNTAAISIFPPKPDKEAARTKS